MNYETFDQMLCAALLEANRLEDQDIEADPVTATWSAGYQRQRRQMLHDPLRWYRRKIAPMWKRVGRAVASFFLVLIIGLTTVLAISPTARAHFFAWVQEIYATYTVYRFGGEPAAQELPQYEIAALPDGFHETDRFVTPGYISVTYENSEGKTIYLDYLWMDESSTTVIHMEGMQETACSVHGWEGYFYQFDAPGRSSTLIWMDLEQNIQFTIDAHGDETVLLNYAEHISIKK